MKQNAQWWHWLIAIGTVVILCAVLSKYVLFPAPTTPPAVRGTNMTDDEVRQKAQAEVDAFNAAVAKHRPQ